MDVRFLEDTPAYVLAAYPYLKATMLEEVRRLKEEHPVELMLDSGAFTAWNAGRSITLDGYCRFLDVHGSLFDHVVQLDVFGDPDRTWQNLLTMRARGYDPIPVFTRGDSLERLEEMYSLTDYVMFGGIVTGKNNKDYVNWFQANNGGRKVHWLGFVDRGYIAHYRPHSVDSSSWHFTPRVGLTRVYAGKGKLVSLSQAQLSANIHAVKPILQGHGCSEECIHRLTVRGKRQWRSGVGAASLQLATAANLLRSKEVYDVLRTKIYLAASTSWQIVTLRQSLDALKQSPTPFTY